MGADPAAVPEPARPRSRRATAGSGRPRAWWAGWSLRARLTAAATIVIAVGAVGAAAVLVWRVEHSLLAGLDTAVTAQAQAVADRVAQGTLPRQLPNSGDGAPTVQVVAADGRVIATSAGLDGNPRLFTLRGAEDPRLATVTVPDPDDPNDPGDTYRVAAVAAHGRRSGPVTVYAALPTAPITQSTGELVTALAVGVPVAVVLLAIVGWLLLGMALRPVETLRRQAAAIPGTDLRRRLPPPRGHDELDRLAGTLNDLLDRIESGTARQRQFAADAAHELRNPLATLRAGIEVAQREPDPVRAAAALPALMADTDRLVLLVDDLLALARADAGPPARRQPVDLDDIVLAQVTAARGRGPTVDATGVSAGRVVGEPAGLARVVRNLLDNATRHAATTVTVRLTAGGGSVVLTVADDGPGIPPADRQRVFERFTRLDDARSRDAGGSGLGLSIVRDVVAGIGGTVAVTDNGPGAVFTVTMPEAE